MPFGFRDHAEVVAVHEFGHLLGMEHCKERCILRDVEGHAAVLDKIRIGEFCAPHRERIGPYLRSSGA